MDDFPKYYTRLFNGITDAIEALQAQNYVKAQDILIKAQQDAEKMYLEDEEKKEAHRREMEELLPRAIDFLPYGY